MGMPVRLRTIFTITIGLAVLIVFSASLSSTLNMHSLASSSTTSSAKERHMAAINKLGENKDGARASCPVSPIVERPAAQLQRDGGGDDEPNDPEGTRQVSSDVVCPVEEKYCTYPDTNFGSSRVGLEPKVPGVRLWKDHCLKPAGDRLEIMSASKAGVGNAQPKPGITFVASDLCAMGHTTKDPVVLLSALLDLIEEDATQQEQRQGGTKSDLIVRVVYANNCMTKHKGGPGGNKRTPVFHNVLIHWFRAVLDFLSLSSSTKDVASSSSSSPFVCHKGLDCRMCQILQHLSGKLKRVYSSVAVIEDFYATYSGGGSKPPCFETLLKRDEHWRWTRTSAHAFTFRAMLHQYYNISSRHSEWLSSLGAKATLGGGGTEVAGTKRQRKPLRVTLLRRDEDRHFGEKRVYDFLASQWNSQIQRGTVEISMIAFDNIKGKKGIPAPTHQEQLQILANTHILIAAHGAGLASVVAMLPGSAVIELFPHNFRYPMYEELADLSAVTYIGIESPVVAPKGCCKGRGEGANLPALQGPSYVHGQGARACKKCDILLSWVDVESMLSEALHGVVHYAEQLCYSLRAQ